MAEIIFDQVIPLPPMTWKRGRVVARGTASGIRVKIINDKKFKQAKQNLAWEVKAAAPQLRCSRDARFGFHAEFFLAGPRGGDGDRYENLLMDALEGVIWENDEQVDEGSWKKKYDSKHVGIQLTIWRNA